MKTLFLVMFVVVLYGCADPAVVRRNEMAEARQMVEAQYGGRTCRSFLKLPLPLYPSRSSLSVQPSSPPGISAC